MKRFALLSLVALVAASAVEGCSGPDVPIAQNAGAGKAGQESAGTNQDSAGSTSNSGGSSNSSAGSSSGGSSSKSDAGSSSGGSSNSTAGSRSSGGSSNSNGGSSSSGGGEIVDVAGAGGAGGDTNGTCNGTAPFCFGNNTANCCGNDPAGQAVCQGGKWLCFGAAAPGCSGDRCIDLFACGPTLKCNQTKQYCRALVGGIGGDQYQCDAFPAECAQAHSCGCIASAACQSCTPEAAGGITQSCQVG